MERELNFSGIAEKYVEFIQEWQLTDENLWKKFINVFRLHSDTQDEGWRSEYWGKMMRGACMVYNCTRSEKLYAALEKAVKGLLSVQEESGRISGYGEEKELCGWDVWGRKYVLVGLEYFYGICGDEGLRAEILTAMRRHADALISKVGRGAGKKEIIETSEWWGGLNSCSVLEPVLGLYGLTGDKKYLEFGEYIISLGGCGKGNLIELVMQGKKPYEFPVTKAYEMMSFFEGVLAYYEITGDKYYLNVVEKFAEAVAETDITLIGCAGCTHELFDNSFEKQTEYSETIMQETCVTVTWMRLSARLWENTKNAKYLERLEVSYLNALCGSVNENRLEMYSFEKKAAVPALPFDSYSPLRYNRRGRGVGGYKELAEGGNYGCCACIAAAGIALYPLYAAVKKDGGIYLNFYLQGEYAFVTAGGREAAVSCITDYPADGKVKYTVHLKESENFKIHLRIPVWCSSAKLKVCGVEYKCAAGYAVIDRLWQDGDTIEAEFPAFLAEHKKNGKTAFTFGAVTLAADRKKEKRDIKTPFAPTYAGGKLKYDAVKPEKGELLRIVLNTKDGNVLLTDYQSCGKDWSDPDNIISVWLDCK